MRIETPAHLDGPRHILRAIGNQLASFGRALARVPSGMPHPYRFEARKKSSKVSNQLARNIPCMLALQVGPFPAP